MNTAKVRIRPESLPWITKLDEHIRMFNMRGVDSLLHAASDALDGAVFAHELDDMRRRGLVRIMKDHPDARLDRLAGYDGCWSAQLTERAMCALWPDRLDDGGQSNG